MTRTQSILESKAPSDKRRAETLLSVVPPVVDTICYRAKQCVERCLKAFLTLVDRHVERTHNALPRAEIEKWGAT